MFLLTFACLRQCDTLWGAAILTPQKTLTAFMEAGPVTSCWRFGCLLPCWTRRREGGREVGGGGASPGGNSDEWVGLIHGDGSGHFLITSHRVRKIALRLLAVSKWKTPSCGPEVRAGWKFSSRGNDPEKVKAVLTILLHQHVICISSPTCFSPFWSFSKPRAQTRRWLVLSQ